MPSLALRLGSLASIINAQFIPNRRKHKTRQQLAEQKVLLTASLFYRYSATFQSPDVLQLRSMLKRNFRPRCSKGRCFFVTHAVSMVNGILHSVL